MSFPFLQGPTAIVRIMVPLPLKSERRCIEFIRCGRRSERIGLSDLRFRIGNNVFTTTAKHRPSIYPFHRYQMRYTPDRASVLHDNKPPVTILQLHHSPLMQTVGRIRTGIIHDQFMFVGSIDVIGTQTYLPAFGSTGRTSEIILPVDLISMGTFHAIASSEFMGILKSLIPYLHFLSLHRFSIGSQLCNIQCPLSVENIYFAIVIEQ